MSIVRHFLRLATHTYTLVGALFFAVYMAHTGAWTGTEAAVFFAKTVCVLWGLHLVLATINIPAQRRGNAQLVPVVVDVTEPADRPTVTEALGRLDPALREMIAISRSEAGA